MTMTDEKTGTIPEEWCSHHELQGSFLSRGYCRGCGALVDVDTIGTVSDHEHQKELYRVAEEAWTEGREAGREGGFDEGREEASERWAKIADDLADLADNLSEDGLGWAVVATDLRMIIKRGDEMLA